MIRNVVYQASGFTPEAIASTYISRWSDNYYRVFDVNIKNATIRETNISLDTALGLYGEVSLKEADAMRGQAFSQVRVHP